jgi:serine/threonine protein phosphatase 1
MAMPKALKSKFRSTPPDDTRVYAVGDIHGQRQRLAALHAKIIADAQGSPQHRRVVVYVGDYVDRGPDSAGVLDLLIESPLAGFTSIFLKGNHEDYVLRYLDGDLAAGGSWLNFGGDATLRSYGIDASARWPDDSELAAWRDEFVDHLPASHRRFLDSLALSHIEGNYAFVHAGVRPGRRFADQTAEDLMWIRDAFHNSTRNHGYVIVHGHSVVTTVQSLANRIAIDTGAGYGRWLSAVVLAGTARRFLHA